MNCPSCGRPLSELLTPDGICGICLKERAKKQGKDIFNCRKCGYFRRTPRCQRCGPEVQEFPLSDFLTFPLRSKGVVTLNIDYAAATPLTLEIGSSSFILPARPRNTVAFDVGKISSPFEETIFFRCGRWGQFAIFTESEKI